MHKYKSSILVVDDALDTLEILDRNLSSKGYRVFTASIAFLISIFRLGAEKTRLL